MIRSYFKKNVNYHLPPPPSSLGREGGRKKEKEREKRGREGECFILLKNLNTTYFIHHEMINLQ